jgi:TonB family protein
MPMRILLIPIAAGAASSAAAQAPAVPALPRTSVERLVFPHDYPASAMAAGEEGDVEFTLTVGPNGRVAQCTIALSSGSSALDSTTCRLMKSRARFDPARDADGTTRFGAAAGRIAWRMPAGVAVDPPSAGANVAGNSVQAPAVSSGPILTAATPKANLASLFSDEDYPASALAARESGRVEFVLQVGVTGRVEGCMVTRSSGSSALDSTTCRLLRSRARFTPARDTLGNPAASASSGYIYWRLPAAPTAG